MIRNMMLVLAVGLTLAACGGKGASNANTEDDMVMGKADAPLTMVEYASVACPHCAAFNNDVFPAFKAKYIDTGQVKWVSREMLTGDQRMASAGFLLARCAGKDKYFQVTDAIYRNQTAIYGDLRAGLLNIAKSVGMSEEDFTKCISDEKAIDALNDRVTRLPQKDDVSATPAFFLNGKHVATSEVTLAQLDAAIAAARGQPAPAAAPATAAAPAAPPAK